ncbi:hypothetical protein BDN72DRAFT_848733 [Pluteus cervinus]|uniref:Uncharacterized protein n=1 Tax=Pluteus cervinus TaxID=181527 RepID=A0ACD3A961_9AGAR|nr:hypothetical protein BDN72DRAFT_848733 [Pluteus cervinus]
MSAATWQAFQGSRVGGGFDYTAHLTGSKGTMNSSLPSTTLFRPADLPQKSRIAQGKAPQLLPNCQLRPPISASTGGMAEPSQRTMIMGTSCAINITVTSTSSGAMSVDPPYAIRHHSEPNLPSTSTSSTFTLARSQSVYHVPIPYEYEDMPADPPTHGLLRDPSPSQRRTPSPAPTEIVLDLNPTIEEIDASLQSQGVKVRDFAYGPPRRERIPEFFHPIYALSEYEYRLNLCPRTVPVPGKTLRRLLDIKWVTQEEAEERWSAMDWEQLSKYDSMPSYPYVLPKTPIPIPNRHERQEIVKPLIRQQKDIADSYVEEIKFQAHLCQEQEEIAMSQELFRKRIQEEEPQIRETANRSPRKRTLHQTSSLSSLAESSSQPEAHKRLRLSPPPNPYSHSQPLPGSSSFTIDYPTTIPQKQFPAPLSSYDPKLYPHAHSQYPQYTAPVTEEVTTPIDTPSTPAFIRSDTPPLDEVEDQLPLNPSISQPQSSQQRRGLGRTLNRTETFSQL